MSKISAMPNVAAFATTHILQLVDTAQPDATANQHMTIADFSDKLLSSAYLFGGATTLGLSTTEAQVVAWDSAVQTGQTSITPVVGGSFTVTDAGTYRLNVSLILENILVGNDNDLVAAYSVNGAAGIPFTTSYYVGSGGGSSQVAVSLTGEAFMNLAASDAVTITLATTGSGNVDFAQRHAVMTRIA